MFNANPTATPNSTKPCLCGCGHNNWTEDALFLSGHDARFASLTAHEIFDATISESEGMMRMPSDALRAKTQRILVHLREVAEEKARRATIKAALAEARVNAKVAKAEAKIKKAPVKVEVSATPNTDEDRPIGDVTTPTPVVVVRAKKAARG